MIERPAELREFLDTVVLDAGAHETFERGVCVMEAVAYVAGEPFSDHPKCASKVIGEFLRSWNDAMNNADRQQLTPLIPLLVGTAADKKVELRRSYLALDWHCRVSAPAWLRLAGLTAEAEAIEATAPITNAATARAAQAALDRAKSAASAARAAARDAAWAAARDAAWAAAWAAAVAAARAAARDAAWAAAWAAAGAAARAAAGAAAWDAAGDAAGAAARDAAGAAAWDAAGAAAWDAAGDAAGAAARDALRPTVVTLQSSAIELVRQMIALSDDASVVVGREAGRD